MFTKAHRIAVGNIMAASGKTHCKPNFKSRTIITPDLVSVSMGQTKILFNKPVYAGFVILEMAKLKMLTFHYDAMLSHYDVDRLKLAYTDTDSLVYQIKTTSNYWRQEAAMFVGDHFDFSNLPPEHPCYTEKNKKVLGKFKDELDGKTLREWVALRSKMYAIRLDDGTVINKGIGKTAVRCRLNFDYQLITG